MSVGHVARLLEGAGIATVIIAVRSFRTRLEQLVLPRVVLTPHPLGRPLGPPGESEQQLKVLQAGLDLLENAKQGGVMVELESYYSFQVA